MLETIQKDFEMVLNRFIDSTSPFNELISYATLPAGKLFRPQLVYALANDLHAFQEDHKLLASAIEVHHAYSLVHDDLPSMDNDDMRRGKLSHHKKFGEWKAILTGDALLNLSFEILSNIQHEKNIEIIKSFASLMGQSGLILGQYLDLSHENQSFEKLCQLHSLKTGNLISFSLTASLTLTEKDHLYEQINQLGQSIGLIFQLIDDLSELNEDYDKHEQDINAFLNFNSSEVEKRVLDENEKIIQICNENNLTSIKNMFEAYKYKMINNLNHINYEVNNINLSDIKRNLLN